MQLKTILNRVQKFKSFVYGNIVWLDPDKRSALLIEVLARANSKPICSGCERPGRWYDTLPPRMFEFVPLWNIAVFFSYAMRRVNCPRCGVKVEAVPTASAMGALQGSVSDWAAGHELDSRMKGQGSKCGEAVQAA